MRAMSTNQASDSAALRARLSHPVIDSDGHWVEFGPQLIDYLKEVGGSQAAEGFRNRPYEGWHLTVPLKERRERRLDQPVWWGVPTRNTLDRATAMLPKLLYRRLDDMGMDFAVLYPTAGLRVPFIADEEIRKVTCRAFNRFSALAVPRVQRPAHTRGGDSDAYAAGGGRRIGVHGQDAGS
jgi:hypothetical protein